MRCVGKDHLAHHDQTIFVKEHVFRAAQADALGFKLPGHGGIGGRVGIGANADVAHLIRPTQERAETVVQRGCQHLGGPSQNLARGAVQRDDVPFAEHPAIGGDQLFVLAVQPQSRSTHHTGQAQAARDHRCMAGDTAAFGQHPNRRMHAANILRRGFAPDQDAGLTACSTCLRCGRGKHQPPYGAPGTCGDALGKDIARYPRVDLRVQKFRQRTGFDPQHCLVMRDHPVLSQGHRNLQPGPGRALNLNRVQNRQMPILDGEFDLHFFAQPHPAGRAMAGKFGEDFGRQILKRGAARVAREIHRFGLFQRVASLRIAQIPPGDLRQSGDRVNELNDTRA